MTWTEEQQRRYEEALAEYDNSPAPPSLGVRLRGATLDPSGMGQVRLTRLDERGNPTGAEGVLRRVNVDLPQIDWVRINLEMTQAVERLTTAFRQQTVNITMPAISEEAMRMMTGHPSAGTHSFNMRREIEGESTE